MYGMDVEGPQGAQVALIREGFKPMRTRRQAVDRPDQAGAGRLPFFSLFLFFAWSTLASLSAVSLPSVYNHVLRTGLSDIVPTTTRCIHAWSLCMQTYGSQHTRMYSRLSLTRLHPLQGCHGREEGPEEDRLLPPTGLYKYNVPVVCNLFAEKRNAAKQLVPIGTLGAGPARFMPRRCSRPCHRCPAGTDFIVVRWASVGKATRRLPPTRPNRGRERDGNDPLPYQGTEWTSPSPARGLQLHEPVVRSPRAHPWHASR